MATYSSNTTIKYDSAVSATITTSGFGSATYTVPSGKFGIFKIFGATSNTNFTVNSASAGSGLASPIIDLGHLGAGATITISSGTSVSALVVGVLFSNTP